MAAEPSLKPKLAAENCNGLCGSRVKHEPVEPVEMDPSRDHADGAVSQARDGPQTATLQQQLAKFNSPVCRAEFDDLVSFVNVGAVQEFVLPDKLPKVCVS